MNSTFNCLASASEFPSPPFFIAIDLSDGRVTLRGELDCGQVHRLAEAVGALVHSPSPCWTIDVSAVTFCDVEGIRGLLGAQRLAALSGHHLSVTRARPWLRRLLDLVDLPVPDDGDLAGTSSVAPA